MQIESLRYFLEAVRCRSLSQAAINLFITPQGLGRSLKALEEELGYTLLERSSKGVFPTSAGMNFSKHVKVILEEYETALKELSANGPTPSRQLPWLCTPYIMGTSVSLLGTSSGSYSFYKMQELPFDQALTKLVEGDSFCALTCEIFPSTLAMLERSEYVVVPWFRSKWGVIWSGNCPLASPESTTCEEVSFLPKAIPADKSLRYFFESAFDQTLLNNTLLETSSWASLLDFAVTQKGISLFDTYALDALRKSDNRHADEISFTPICDPPASFVVAFVYPKNKAVPEEYQHHFNATKTKYLFAIND